MRRTREASRTNKKPRFITESFLWPNQQINFKTDVLVIEERFRVSPAPGMITSREPRMHSLMRRALSGTVVTS
jgi:hypothetical protein